MKLFKKKTDSFSRTFEEEMELFDQEQAKADELNKSDLVKEWEEMAKVFPAGTEVEFLGVKLFVNYIKLPYYYVDCKPALAHMIYLVSAQLGECSCDYVDGKGIIRKKNLTIGQLRSILEKRSS